MINVDLALRARVTSLQNMTGPTRLSSASDILEYSLQRHPDDDDDVDYTPLHIRARQHLVSRDFELV